MRISTTDSLDGPGGGAGVEVATAEVGGAGVTGGIEMSGCGIGAGELGRGEPSGGDGERSVVTIGEVVVIIGEKAVAIGEVVVTGKVDAVAGGEVVATAAVTIGEVTIGAVATGAEIGLEASGRDGAIGSTDCDPPSPATPRLIALPETAESAVEAAAFVAARRAFFTARSASLEVRAGAGRRLDAAGGGRLVAEPSRLIGALKSIMER